MTRRIVIEPVTRVEGHARVTLSLGDDGRLGDARVEVTQLRGFEAFCVGRLVTEMPALTSRVCGICPASHALAAARAGDVLLGAEPPPAARRLRRLLHLAQLVQSHALSFFFLASPDLALGPDEEPAHRSFLRVAEVLPELVRDGIALRGFGQQTIERIAGTRVHPAFAVAGGVTRPLAPETRDAIAADVPPALACARRALAWWHAGPERAPATAADVPLEAISVALVGGDGALDHCEGRLRAVTPGGEVLADAVDPARYPELLGEATVPWSYATLPYWRARGFPAGVYRVGALARLDVVDRCGTPEADLELARLRGGGRVRTTRHAHHARLVELLHALERIAMLLDDPLVLGRDVLAPPGARRPEGVGACEAPRGTLFHRYRADEDGVVRAVDLIVATGQNGLAMNGVVRRIAERALGGGDRITPALAEAVQAGIRAFDPCLSCASHAAGTPAAQVRLVGPGGALLDVWPREHDAR
jgi:NAD-reducing hydrogenase large subunit